MQNVKLFEEFASSPWFAKASIILLLNKIDVFKNKLPFRPLECYQPEYTGQDINSAAKFILWKFSQAYRPMKSRKGIFPQLVVVSYQNRPRVDGLVPKSDIHQGSAEFHMH